MGEMAGRRKAWEKCKLAATRADLLDFTPLSSLTLAAIGAMGHPFLWLVVRNDTCEVCILSL